MFYTKYRPQTFSEISKPNQIADALVKQLLDHKVAHAYLFVGPRGVGKTTTARLLSKALNCTDLQANGDPCNACSACVSINDGSYIDLIEIDAASHRGIDDIRSMREKANLAPSTGTNKIYIIDEVHMLTTEAFNALLKTLEEPPAHVHFILCTTELHKVPDTIKSRCQVFKFKSASMDQLVTKLGSIAQQEKAKVSKSDLIKIARSAAGGFRDAETLLQQVIEGGVDADSLIEASKYSDYDVFVNFLIEKDLSNALIYISDVAKSGTDLFYWTGGFLNYLRNLLFYKSGAHDYLISNGFDLDTFKTVSTDLTVEMLGLYLQLFSSAQAGIKDSYIPQISLEIALCEVCSRGNNIQTLNATFTPKAPPSAPQQKKASPISIDSEPQIEKQMPNDETGASQAETEITQTKSDQDLAAEIAQTISLETIKEFWPTVVENLFGINVSICTLIKNATPISINQSILNLEVAYPFHKERLEVVRNRLVVEEVLSQIYGNKLRISCIVNQDIRKKSDSREVGNLTDLNIVMPGVQSEKLDSSQLINMLDGGLPL